jgi:predicted dehydrogenase
MKEIVEGGSLGRIRHIEAHFCIPLIRRGDIRFRFELAGGATMDVGCYAINLVRFLAGAEPEVVRARARLSSPQVDRYMSADLRFADGRTGRITCSLFSSAWSGERAVRVRRGDGGPEPDRAPPLSPPSCAVLATAKERIAGRRPTRTSSRPSWARYAKVHRCRPAPTTRSRT